MTATLLDDLLTVYERACRQDVLDIADQLFQILETTERKTDGQEPVELALQIFAASLPKPPD